MKIDIYNGENKDGLKTNYWNDSRSNWVLIALSIVCPLVGLIVMCRIRKDWISRPRIVILLVSWIAISFLLAAYVTHTVSSYEHPEYKSSVDTTQIGATSQPDQNGTGKIPELPTENAPATQQPPAASGTQPAQQPAQSGDVMSGITMANPESVPYSRISYQPNWSVGSGCDIRSRILTSVSIVAVTYGSNGCTVTGGSWNDPYTGQVFTGNPYEGDGTANDLDIDHIIPLDYVNSHGGYHWSDTQKRAYGDSLTAMNNGVYLAASASENRKKGDSGPSVYYPPNTAYRCKYSEEWRNTARTYNIFLSPADYRVVASVLVSCGIR